MKAKSKLPRALVSIALTTPFNTDWSIDTESLRQHLRFLSRKGIGHLLIGGSTGEALRMSVRTRVKLLAAARESFGGKIAFNISAASPRDTAQLLRQGRRFDVDSFVFTLPVGNPTAPCAGLCQYVDDICGPNRKERFFFYAHPSTGIDPLHVNDVLGHIIDTHSNVVGIKDSIPGSPHLKYVRRTFPGLKGDREFMLVTGDDTQIRSNFENGLTDGVVSGAMNPFPAQLLAYIQALLSRGAEKITESETFLQNWVSLLRQAHRCGLYAYGTQEIPAIKHGVRAAAVASYPTIVSPPLHDVVEGDTITAIEKFAAAAK
jgi:dihydrodipicolinate synthase/N-acetylneuraminate lyase